MEKKKVAEYIGRERLFLPADKVLVALSGGADSVALLCLLREMGYACEAAHCNFHLRGTESDRDEAFVRQLCRERQVVLHLTHFDTTRIARERQVSVEMAARELRYGWFEQVRQACGAAVVAVAHHKDDSVETFLLNLIRGTGIEGLRGIRPRNGNVVRPLLCLDRREIAGYLQRIGQAYVTDSTNLQDLYTRNKIRLRLLPLMQEINPSVKESILATAGHLDDATLLYRQGIEEGKRRVLSDRGIRIDALLQEPAPKTLLFEMLHPLGFNPAQIKDVFRALDGQPGKTFIGRGYCLLKDRDYLLIEQQDDAPSVSPVVPLNEAVFGTTDTTSCATENVSCATTDVPLVIEEAVYSPDFIIPRDKHTACFDADKLHHPLTQRLCRPGDKFVPFGMKGMKKVSDYLTDRKFSVWQKMRQPLLCCGEDIVWLIGERTDNRFRVDERTKGVMVVKMPLDR